MGSIKLSSVCAGELGSSPNCRVPLVDSTLQESITSNQRGQRNEGQRRLGQYERCAAAVPESWKPRDEYNVCVLVPLGNVEIKCSYVMLAFLGLPYLNELSAQIRRDTPIGIIFSPRLQHLCHNMSADYSRGIR